MPDSGPRSPESGTVTETETETETVTVTGTETVTGLSWTR